MDNQQQAGDSVNTVFFDYFCQRVRDAYLHWRRHELRLKGDPHWKSFGCVPVPSWDGGVDAYGREHTSVWPKLAAFLLERQIDPDSFIRSQLHLKHLPTPNMLISQQALARYEQFKAENAENLRARLLSETSAFKIKLVTSRPLWPDKSDRGLWECVLLSPFGELSPLFRVCVACMESIPSVVTQFWCAAVEQYLVDREGYDKHWKEIMTPVFNDLVTQSIGASPWPPR